jgi:hypothetical protein
MSMHEFEAIVEVAIRKLAASPRKDQLDLRSLFWNLYAFQKHWDTGFTHFGVMDILLAERFAYRFRIEAHPDYTRHKEYFDALDGFSFIYAEPEREWDKDTNPAVGYFKSPYLYCDAGSPLWQRWIEAGLLSGMDTVPPVPMDIVELKAQSCVEQISWWYSALFSELFLDDEQRGPAMVDPSIKEIREIVLETGAIDIDPGYGCLAYPPRDVIEEYPFAAWWFEIGEG